MIRNWTPRHTEACGLLALVVGIGWFSVAAALIVGGLVLILAAYVRADNGGV